MAMVDESFAIAIRAFGLMTQADQLRVLDQFRRLRMGRSADRFHEATYRVVTNKDSRSKAEGATS